jgi:hypothetical protein
MDKFDFGDLNRFLVSVGLALLLASVGVPWLFYREPFDLVRTTSELDSLTPYARAIVLERQSSVGLALGLVPWISLLLAVLGLGLLIYGLWRWWPFQRDFEEIQTYTLAELKQRVQQMTPAEVEAKARAEVAAISVPSPVLQGEGQVTDATQSASDRVDQYIQNQNLFLDILAANVPSGYELLPQQRFGPYTYDALLRHPSSDVPDFVIEFKDLSTNYQRRHLEAALRVASTAADWLGLTRKAQTPIVVALVPEDSPQPAADALALTEATRTHPTAYGRALLRLISSERLRALSTADITTILDTSERVRILL